MRTYADYHAMVEESLVPTLRSLGSIPRKLEEAMVYSLAAGGKRLRPVLLLAACDMAGGDVQAALPFACALEMIHTYSLIHDDLPAMDNDDLRRGKPTNHRVFGEDVAILAGDGLLSAAMEVMLRAACAMGDMRGTRAACAIASHAGVTGMVAGQTIDVTEEGTEPTMEKVSYIHAHKTADLLTAPMEAGLMLAGADDAAVKCGADYGYHLGMAFQMVDDLLDLEGDAVLLGKNTGVDAALGKLTWPTVRGVEDTRRDAGEHIAQAVQSISCYGERAAFLQELAASTLSRVK